MGACLLLVVLQAMVTVGEESADTLRAVAVHHGGRELVCATAKGCRWSIFLPARISMKN
jgi:prolactin regulatory element-binding protein